MKVLHITTHLNGGAALAALRLHQALLDCGEESRVLTLDEVEEDNSIIQYKPFLDFSSNRGLEKIVKSLLYRLNIGMGRWWRMHDKARAGHECQYTYPVSPYRVERHPLVKWADIIHLHFCDDFINYPSFFKSINKPIFWTLHDIGIGYGGFHYKDDYDRLLPHFKDLELQFVAIKREAISNCSNLHIISLSQEMTEFVKTIDFLSDKPNNIIPNCVDISKFNCLDKQKSRATLGLPPEKKILLFVSEFVQTKSKGLDLLKNAVEEINNDNILLCIVGNYPNDMPSEDRIPTRYFGKINDSSILNLIYSASDFLVAPSSQESFGQTPLEAMACGTPVVVFPTGAMKDYVTKDVGAVCKDCSKDALKQSLLQALQTEYNHISIRQYLSKSFNPKKIAQEYMDAYCKG